MSLRREGARFGRTQDPTGTGTTGVVGRLGIPTRTPGGSEFAGNIAARVDIAAGVEPVTLRSIDFGLHATGFLIAADYYPPGRVLSQLIVQRADHNGATASAWNVGQSDDPSLVRFRGTVSGQGRLEFDASERNAPVSGLLLDPGVTWSVVLSTPIILPEVVVPGGVPTIVATADRPWSVAWLAVRYDLGDVPMVGTVDRG